MNALEILRTEHAIIREHLDNLAFAVAKLERDDRPPLEFWGKVVAFSRHFLDKYHHFKEEHGMFALLAARKDGAIDRSVEALSVQHERGRELLGDLARSLEAYGTGSERDVLTVLETAAAYTTLMRHHVYREERVFFPLVRETLTDSDDQRLLELFEREDRRAGVGYLDRARQTLVEMGRLLTP